MAGEEKHVSTVQITMSTTPVLSRVYTSFKARLLGSVLHVSVSAGDREKHFWKGITNNQRGTSRVASSVHACRSFDRGHMRVALKCPSKRGKSITAPLFLFFQLFFHRFYHCDHDIMTNVHSRNSGRGSALGGGWWRAHDLTGSP